MDPISLDALIDQLNITRGARWRRHRNLLQALLPLVAQGMPVSPTAIAVTLGVEDAHMAQILDTLRHYGCEFDADGNLVGAILTQIPTPHQFRMAGHNLYAWCALDTLFLPTLLHQSAVVRSICPVTRQEITLQVTPERVETHHPPQIRMSLVTTECHTPGPHGDFCGHIFFFASDAAGTTWIGTQGGVELLSVQDAFTVGRAVYGL